MRAPDTSTCLNCGTTLIGPYCHRCGQRDQDVRLPLRRLLAELFEDVLQWDSRLFRTLRALIGRPGLLTVEYLNGRRVRYVPPLRLFLISSVVFLVGMTLSEGALVVETTTVGGGGPAEAGPASLTVSGALEDATGFAAILGRGLQELERDPARGRELWSRTWTWMAFLMMPVFAGLLVPAFRRCRRLYSEHLVFSVHVHSFAFLVTAVAALATQLSGGRLARPVGIALLVALGVYLVAALRRVYGLSRLQTTVRGFAVMVAHAIIVAVLAVVAVFTTVVLVASG